MSYCPSFQTEYTHEELVEHFWLHSEEIEFVESFRSEVNKQTVAVLLKGLEYLGGFPESLEQIPEQVRIFIANQFNLLWDYTPNYLWESSTKAKHLSQIREFAGWRFPIYADKAALESWLRNSAMKDVGSEEELFEAAIKRLKNLKIELPSEKELQKLTTGAWNGFFQNLYH